ncbi:FAD-dependent oxidoreductase, partial [Streptomyces hyaluromycini]
MRTVAVVGASLAGLSAARSLRRRGYDGRLVVVGDEPHRPYDRPPLSKEFLAGTLGEADLALERDDEELHAEWLLGTRATGLDRTVRAVRLADGREVRADGVVIATGAAARTLPGAEGLAGVHTLRTLDDARALREDLA